MFLRATIRKKDGKEHRYFSIVENKRVRGGRVVQRHVLYLGEINSSQELAWRKSIQVLDEERAGEPRTLALFAEDRCEALIGDESIVRLRLLQLRVQRHRKQAAEAGLRYGRRVKPRRYGDQSGCTIAEEGEPALAT